MNWIIISIGMALVIALTAAAVGPLFVDWTAYRASIEAQAERLLGADVTIAGEADLRLLPSPRIQLTDVTLGDPTAPLLTSGTVEIDVALSPLLSRTVRVLDLRLGNPVLAVRIDENGTVERPPLAIEDEAAPLLAGMDVVVDNVTITNGTVRLSDARTGRQTALYDMALTGQARSLTGPFTIRGATQLAGESVDVRVAGGALDAAGTMALSLRITPQDERYMMALDGTLTPSLAAPRLAGDLTLELATDGGPPLTLSGAATVTPERITLARAPLRYGTGDAELELTTTAIYRMVSDDPMVVTLDARQMDLDRLVAALANPTASLAAAASSAEPPREAVRRLAAHFQPIGELLVNGGGADALVEFNAGTIVLGGSVLRDLSIALRAGRDDVVLERAEVLLPGDTSVDLTGQIADGFNGRLAATATEPGALARWWTGSQVTAGESQPVRLDTSLAVSPDGDFSAPRFQLRVGQSSASGRLIFGSTGSQGRPEMELFIGAPFLDAGDIAAVAGLLREGSAFDLGGIDLVLDVSVERVRVGSVEGDALNIDAQYADGTLTVDALIAEDLAGAELLVSGDLTGLDDNPVGTISGTLALRDTARLAEAVESLAPTSVTASHAAQILSRTPSGALVFSLSGGAAGTQTLSARLRGDLGSTLIDAEVGGALSAADGDRNLSFGMTLDNPSTAGLLHQLGVPGVGAGDPRFPGPAAVVLDLDGPNLSQLFADLSAQALGASVDYEGGIGIVDGSAALNGSFQFAAQSLAPLGALTGRLLPVDGETTLAADFSTEVDGALNVSNLSGTIDGVAMSGALTVADGALGGSLSLGEARLSTLLAFILGRDAFQDNPDAVDGWPTTAFTAPILPALSLDVALGVDRLWIGPQDATDATMTLALSPSVLSLSEISTPFLGGMLEGNVRIARDGPRADAAATLSLRNGALEGLLWAPDGAPVATGRFDVEMDVATSGFTIADIMAGLTGQGALALNDVAIARLNGAPFDVSTLLGDGTAPPADDAVLDAFEAHLLGDTLALPAENAPLQINAGTVRLDAVPLGPNLAVSGAADLAAWQLRGTITADVASDRADKPSVSIGFSGSLGAPERSVDLAALTAWLSLVQLEDQVRAVEEQNEELAAEADAIDGGAPNPNPAPPTPLPAPQEPDATEPLERESRLNRRGRIVDELRETAGAAPADGLALTRFRAVGDGSGPTATAVGGTVREEQLRRLGVEPFRMQPEDVN